MSKSLPSITSQIPRDLRNFVDRLRELVNGGGAGRLVTAKDLADAGVVTIGSDGSLSASAVTTDYGTPPAPTGVTATPAIRNVIIEWDTPAYPTHAYAEVWGASTDNQAAAVLLGQTPGAVYADELGPSATRYYWVRFVNTQFTAGPFNGLSGTVATTGADLAYTMDLLQDTYGGTSEAPFFQLDAPQVIGGVTIPAGTYMKAGFIYDGEITNAKIANAAIDNAKISNLSASKITTGAIAVGNTISSANYIAGSQGWNIDGSGTAELSNAVVRGAVYASSGTFAGSLSAATGTFAGSLSAATGSFAGSLSSATGSFSGEVTVGASPAISGTTMTGTGAHVYSDGRVIFGSASKNITWNGSTLTINGDVVGTSNLNGVAIGQIIAGSFNFVSFTTVGTSSFVIPPYVYKVKVTCIGGGGGGYNVNNSTAHSGGGGGAACIGIFSVTPGDTYSVTVGSGGAVQAAGGASSFVGTGANMVAGGGAAGVAGPLWSVYAAGGVATGGNINLRGSPSGPLIGGSMGGPAPLVGTAGGASVPPPANSGGGGAGRDGLGSVAQAGGSGLVIIEY